VRPIAVPVVAAPSKSAGCKTSPKNGSTKRSSTADLERAFNIDVSERFSFDEGLLADVEGDPSAYRRGRCCNTKGAT
jgi:hypothetical protein